MDTDRRWFLKALATATATSGLAGCRSDKGEDDPNPSDTLDDSSTTTTDSPQATDLQPGPWAPDEALDETLFFAGVQVGDVTKDSAVFSVQADLSTVDVRVVEQRADGWLLAHEMTLTRTTLGFRQELVLRPGTTYRWAAMSAGKRSRIGTFRTPPAEDGGVVRFGATSCLGGNEPWPLLSRAAEQDLDVFLFLGDTVYADWGADEPVADKWTHALSQPGMVDLCTSTSVIATWDDHEVWNAWTMANTPMEEWTEARRAFRDAMPQTQGPSGGIWRSVRWGSVAFFVLDCRGERAGADYISDEQMQWLLEGLEASDASFKIVVNSVPITDLSFIPVAGQLLAGDRWQGYPAQRRQLTEVCAGIDGLLFVSGDFHVGAAAYIDDEDANAPDVMEVLAGPGGSAVSSVYSVVPEGGRLPVLVADLNYTQFECNPDDMTVQVAWVDNNGSVIRSMLIQL